MSSLNFYKWANLVVFLMAVAGLILGIKFEGILANSIIKTIFWIIIGAWIGLTAYLGQKEITKDLQGQYNLLETIRYAESDKVNNLKIEIGKLEIELTKYKEKSDQTK